MDPYEWKADDDQKGSVFHVAGSAVGNLINKVFPESMAPQTAFHSVVWGAAVSMKAILMLIFLRINCIL